MGRRVRARPGDLGTRHRREGIAFGEGVAGARAGLYFAAGPDDEMHGMFGVITAPTPAM